MIFYHQSKISHLSRATTKRRSKHDFRMIDFYCPICGDKTNKVLPRLNAFPIYYGNDIDAFCIPKHEILECENCGISCSIEFYPHNCISGTKTREKVFEGK